MSDTYRHNPLDAVPSSPDGAVAVAPYHVPALLPECMEALDIKSDGVYVDVTYGGGGHSKAILERLGPQGHLFSFDRDREAVDRAPHDDSRFTMVWSNFRFLTNFLRYHGVTAVDGVLADLGVSFHHFDDASRGFTFRDANAPLDMRMNRRDGRTAADIVNTYSAEELATLLRVYGEVSSPQRIAAAIVRARAKAPLHTTGALTDAVESLVSPARRKKELAKVFQALRIEVNDEMGALKCLLASALKVLSPGGRLAIITYHSLEDRMVKNFMRTGNVEGDVDKDFFGNVRAPLQLLTAKPIVPSDDEVLRNPRSRSAHLRTARKPPE